ncbi:hypothetical protein [Spirillospora sp. NPDC047279]|uniref:hypothetical protein n=1 Tax=Spirillospora sp. NPDC047279 TaxID=3155478 RepID=UPI0033EBD768
MADNQDIAIEYLRRLDVGGDLFEIRDGLMRRVFIYLDPTTAPATPPAIPGAAKRG